MKEGIDLTKVDCSVCLEELAQHFKDRPTPTVDQGRIDAWRALSRIARALYRLPADARPTAHELAAAIEREPAVATMPPPGWEVPPAPAPVSPQPNKTVKAVQLINDPRVQTRETIEIEHIRLNEGE